MNLSIRPIQVEDLDNIVSLMREFAAYENLSEYCEVTVERLSAAMFGEVSSVEGLIASDGETPIGYALYYPNFASFRGQRGLYLEDLYIADDFRGKAIGESLIKEMARIAASRGFERIDFMVLDWNESATRFYQQLGAIRDDTERHFKFTDDAFKKLCQ